MRGSLAHFQTPLHVVYRDARHCVGNVPSAHLGPHPQTLVAGWVSARLNDKAFASERWFVEASGHIVKTAYRN